MRVVGNGFCFGLNVPTDMIPKQMAFNSISIACSFQSGWSTERHKFYPLRFKEIVFRILLSFLIHKKNKTLSVPPKPIQLLIIKALHCF